MKSPSSAQPDGGRPSALQEAAAAIEEEYRTSVKVRRLLCRRAEDVRDNREPWIVCLQVGSVGPWDWTFEGSTAFVPLPGDKPAAQALEDGEVVWRGEVVEVEPVKGLLYVALESVEEAAQVTPGVIWIRPFPFLWPLREIYQSPHLERYRELLPPLLEATLTGRLDRPERAPVGSDGLERVWAKPWGILWGPPGTGKTYRIGEQVADVLAKTDERVLVVSTTNRATDAVALSIGRALRRRGRPLDPVVRAGTGSHYGDYARTSMLELLAGTETAARQRFADLAKEIRQTTDPDRRARLQSDRALVRQQIENGSLSALLDPDKRVVVMTAAGASNVLGLEDVVQAIESGDLLFTTVILDEAGLLPRVSAAALSLFASWRTLLVGDPAQLAPISRIARVLPPRVARWIQMSALEHLDPSQEPPENVRLLTRQYRMHPAIRRVVSEYQYHGRLEDAGEVEERPAPFADALLTSSPRAVWIVFDEEPGELSHKRAERGPGQRSWIRRGTLPWLERLFGAIPELAKGPGLFLSPFVAQARAVDGWLARSGFTEWEASTVHAQQGTEARFVLFDTVNAGSHVWPTVEWKRLINVGLSRAREMAFLLATRQEMQEPYLAPLKSTLAPRVLEHRGSAWHWCSVPVVAPAPTLSTADRADSTLGRQIESRRALRPVLNREQERLCRLSLDGAGRVVRGVAGSGKTVILAHWLVQTLLNEPALGRLWVVYANEALKGLLGRTLLEVWEERQPGIAFPWERVTLWHVRHLLVDLHRRTGQEARFEFDYEKGAAELDRSRLQEALCDALFIDEAQDLGHVTLELLVSLVHSDPGSDQRRIVIFCDNAHNLYGRRTRTWSELGLDMRGRSTV
ncbi:MAG: AAA domain-containing protein, partial [Planctomycetota bacterium]